MVFNNYYLQLLIDLGFIITDYKAIAVFEKNAAYEPFVRTMMNLKIQAILPGSTKEKFYKLIIYASYGYDTLNTEKFGKMKLLDKAGTFIAQHHPNHIGTRSDPAKDCHQQFESIVTDKRFYDQHVYQYSPDPNKDIYDYKKILGFGIEYEGYELASLGPKCYSMIVNKWNKENQQYEFKPRFISKDNPFSDIKDSGNTAANFVGGINANTFIDM
ncbi:MAG: hypothetical protein EZS28_041397 [Streblomastix strix]|uniref:Uncharacterized protein n=1 Tax=Streblomastix strix TaxID=222440 RepID=A0A5J4TX62_9EUKA|nr:MAG: hypothetical protein EZS28_041397 [Streblomastix strix]